MELVQTKLEVPAAAGDLLARPRLTAELGGPGIDPLVVVHAPAGYGKTTLLLQAFLALQDQGLRTAWLSVDESDQDTAGFLMYVAAALARAGVEFEPSLERFSSANPCPTPESILALVSNAVARCDSPVSLFLDDVHLLGADPSRALANLIERARPTMRFVMASRSLPELRLARIRARGGLREVGVEELRFTRDESARFLCHSNAQLADGELDLLDGRVEGWITGIKLLSLAVRNGTAPGEVLTSYTGGQRCIADFFAEEVLASQPSEVRQFLLKTSVLDRFCPELCEQVAGLGGAADILAQIEKAGLFLVPLDEERNWFRYHHLFAEFLQRRLRQESPVTERALHASASEWCWNAGRYVESIEHALRGGEPGRAAQLLELRCQDMTYAGKFQLVRKFTAQIPEPILRRHPRILLTMAWLLTRNLCFEESRAILGTVRARIDEMRESGEAAADELRRLEYLLLHREMVLTAAQDDPIEVEKQCRLLIDNYAEQRHPYLSGTIYAQLLFSHREQYQLGDLERLTSTAQGILARSEFPFGSIALQASVAPSLFFAGRTDAAVAALEQGLAEAIRCGGINSQLAALPGLPLAEVLYETNQLERAKQLVHDTLPHATEMGFVDQLRAGFVTCARIARAEGDRPAAFQALDSATTIAIERGLERLRCAVVEERVRLLIQDGRPDEAAQYLDEAGITGPGEALLPRGTVTTVHESRALAWARTALAEDRIGDALGVARHWRSFCSSRRAVRSRVRWDILLAQILYVSGDLRGAQRALREAIAHAAGARLIRSFVDEGTVVRNLLRETYEGELEVLHPTDAFASVLQEAFEVVNGERPALKAQPAPSQGLYGKLSKREREILALVSSGMRNREVGKTLGMTEGSVKWYMQQVYDKVGTRRRLQAVERARQFGLIG